MTHSVIKPEKIAATAAVALEQALVVPALFQREGIDQFKGAKDDTINVKVEGVLPFRTYDWRSGQVGTPNANGGVRKAIEFDEYTEKTVAVSFGGNIYSAVALTDEQRDFDLNGWAKLVSKQTEAISRGLERGAVDHLLAQDYAVTLGGKVGTRTLRSVLIRARDVLNKFMVPKEGRVLLVGSDWEVALLEDEKLNLASNVGDAEAVAALHEATIGRRFGFDIVVSQEIPADAAFALHRSAFIFATGAPTVPQSVTGGSASANGVAVRWLQDYDALHLTDRSVINTYKGFREVKDQLIGIDAGTGQAFVSQYEHFVRAIKLDLDATVDVLPDPDGPDAAQVELAAITGVKGAADGAGV
ncbi:major head protein [Streptomyces phage Werner]|uniref:Major capsid protein n=1 Tax=Streptomyces phage Werner TaxID=2801898 RepID=A0A7U0J7E5_9CAUD|nr:major head protein [Streptomyces phage Werner]QFP95177.1 major capsid protein [Streptomyces phage Whatever]QQO39625.1 major capsid protein [Streptomyces phage Hippo]QQO39932.1 major capsid protein [Streptomyces phage Dwayne]QYW07194.1 major capsid protein [Streptomyces phage Chucky]QZE11078.1 major capsid protein [Streptomyces phage SarahRose]UKH48512.1 major capsid protein [Streptomyces phage Snorlax]WAB09792.1 major capsid protein [Streptomyces phage TagePhighter]WNM66770.1 major capsi